jgi:dipeptidyl aminopeptidase/acylaminoacyl peptidase
MIVAVVCLFACSAPFVSAAHQQAVTLKHFDPEGIAALAFSPDGKVLATAGVDNYLRLWEVAKEKELRSVKAHPGGVFGVVFSADGQLVLSAGADGVIRLWDAATLKEQGQLQGHEKAVTCLALAADGKTLASGSMDKTVRLWDLVQRKEHRKMEAHASGVHAVAFTADGKALLSAGDATTIIQDGGNTINLTHPDKPKLWHVAKGQLIRAYDIPGGVVALSPDQRVLATMALITEYKPGQLKQSWHFGILDGFTGRALGKVEQFGTAMTFSPDGKTLAMANNYGSVLLWEVATGKLAYERPKYGGNLVAFAPDGKRLAVAISHSGGGKPMPGGQPQPARLRFLELPPDQNARQERAKDLDAKQLEQLWDDLLATDAKKGYEAIWTLAAVPDKTLALFKERLQPAKGVEVAQFQKLLTDLDSDVFAKRDAASTALQKLGPVIAPALQDLLASEKMSLETQQRLQAVLAKMPPWIPRSGEALRQGRAVQVLELIGTAEAQAQLLRLAGDQQTLSQLAHDARMAQKRLTK